MKNLKLSNINVMKQIWCLLFHRTYWTGHIFGSPPIYAVVQICRKCGCRHVSRDSIMTQEDIDRRRAKVTSKSFLKTWTKYVNKS